MSAKKKTPYSGGITRPVPPMPTAVKYALAIVVPLTLIPLAMAINGQFSFSEQPRRHFFQDMGNQPRYNTQAASDIFADGRAMRPVIEGTVAYGQLQDDDHYYRGFSRAQNPDGSWKVTFFTGFPEQVTITEAFIRRGQQRYNIYCATCHGADGAGVGPIHLRATELGEANWRPPANLHQDTYIAREEGHLYNTINNGIRTMAGYGAQIPVDDRWAIVAYIRALQLSQSAPESVLPREVLDSLPSR